MSPEPEQPVPPRTYGDWAERNPDLAAQVPQRKNTGITAKTRKRGQVPVGSKVTKGRKGSLTSSSSRKVSSPRRGRRR